jgi:YfiH family protein
MMFDTDLQPNDGFRWVQVGPLHALVCRALEPFAAHFMTTRAWDLGAPQSDADDPAWTQIARAIGRPLVRVRQVHGASVLVRRAGAGPTLPLTSADIIVSDDEGTAVAVQTADCVPILIADRRTGAVAVAHAGWRGLAAGVPREAVHAMRGQFGSRPGDLVAAAGPSIGACCYEVGADVQERFEAAGWPAHARAAWFRKLPQPTARNPSMPQLRAAGSDRWYFDCWGAVRDQLESAGVEPAAIFVAELCTASHPGPLCSYRRDGAGAGRMAAVIRPVSSQPVRVEP